MRILVSLTTVLAIALAIGCRSEEPVPPYVSPEAPPIAEDKAPLYQPPSESPRRAALEERPPHVFHPRSHQPRRREAPPEPDLSSLPRMVTRPGACARVKSRVVKSRVPKLTLRRPTVSGAPTRAGAGAPETAMPREEAASRARSSKKRETAAALKKEAAGTAPPANELRIAAGGRIQDKELVVEIKTDETARGDYESYGAAVYLSNDDTMSLSSAQRVIYAIDKFMPLPVEHIRPHELLNYFSFETAEVRPGDDFSVLADIEADPRQRGNFSLAVSVKGRSIDKRARRNAAITLVLDRSGSMRDEGRMGYLKQGLRRMLDELKPGDMVHLMAFDQEVCAPLENFVVGRDSRELLERAIDAIPLGGSTDLHEGLRRGYEIADRTYRPQYTNRVVLITDAMTNTGVTSERMISVISKYFDSRRIRLSGVGVGSKFNDALLNRLTERGRGAYVFLGSEAEVEAMFGDRFISLIETTANNVRFRLHLPPSLKMSVFYGEESSTVKEDVQEIHYFANTSQLFFSDLTARKGVLRPDDWIMMTVEYQDPETGEELVEEHAFNVGAIQGASYNVKKARLIMAWIDHLTMMAERPTAPGYRQRAGGWEDAGGWQRCETGRGDLAALFEGLEQDPEARRVLDLWDKFCARFDRPRNPVQRRLTPGSAPGREPVKPENSWPSALPDDLSL